ncbi:MAG TPA: zinc ABC transporter substrate-binding protein [Candidatus Competibacter sp.]|nr:zinc ABC transporter substrate-binding protein [Candidatus Competibacter sp.]
MWHHATSLKLLRELLGLLLFLPLIVLAEPKVVVSIKPVHSLVSGVMQGVGEPSLLVQGGASPHEYNLKPSDARAISEAQIVFWIGPDMENFMVKPLSNAKGPVRPVALLDAPGVAVLPLREGGAWEPHEHEHDDHREGPDHDRDHDRTAGRDPHAWLDPAAAAAMVRQIVATLGEVDPGHRADYERNGAALVGRLNQLDRQLATELAPVKSQPYIVFHDAYQYFERRYGLSGVGSITLDPERRPGAKRVAEIRARVRDLSVRCVFGEPQFQPALVETIIAGSNARRGVLDPEGGTTLQAGPEAYFQLLGGLADALRTCLSGG